MRISITQIAPRGGFSFAILAQTGLEPVRTHVQWCLRPSPIPVRILSQGATNYLLVANNIYFINLKLLWYYNCFNMFVAICNEISTVV